MKKLKSIEEKDFVNLGVGDPLKEAIKNINYNFNELTSLETPTPISICGSILDGWYDPFDKATVVVQGSNCRRLLNKTGAAGRDLIAPLTAGQTPTIAADGGIAVTGGQHLDSESAFAKRYAIIVATPAAAIDANTAAQCFVDYNEVSWTVRFGASAANLTNEVICGLENDGIGADHRYAIDNKVINSITASKHIFGFNYDGIAGGASELTFDGSPNLANISVNSQNDNPAISNISIGSRANGTTPFSGTIYDIILLNAKPSILQQYLLNQFLMQKHGLKSHTIILSGQSNFANIFSETVGYANAGRAAYRTAVYGYGNDMMVNVINAAVGSSFTSRRNAETHPNPSERTNYWVDDSVPNNLKDGPRLIDFANIVANSVTPIDACILFQGEADGVRMLQEIGAMTTLAEFLPVRQYLIKRHFEITKRNVYITDLAGRGTLDTEIAGKGYQIVREANQIILNDTANYPYAKKGATTYDLPTFNNGGDVVHLTPSSYEELMRRTFAAIAFDEKIQAHGIGPRVTNAVRSGANITLTVTHNGATEFVAAGLGSANPLSFTNGSNIMTVTFPNHGFVSGEQVAFRNAAAIVNLTAPSLAQINATFTITVVDANTFTVTLPVAATVTGGGSTSGGGTSASCLRLTNRQAQTIALSNNPITPVAVGGNQMVIAAANHNLAVGDRVFMAGAATTSGIPATAINGNREVIEVVPNVSFTIAGGASANASSTTPGGGTSVTYLPAKNNFFRVFGNNDGIERVVTSVTITPSNQITLQVDGGTSPVQACTVYVGFEDRQWVVRDASGAPDPNQMLRDTSPNISFPLQTSKHITT